MPILAEWSITSATDGGPVSHKASAHWANITSTKPIAASRSATKAVRYVRLELPDSRAYSEIVQTIATSTSNNVAHGAQLHLESSCQVAESAFDGTGAPSHSANQAGNRPLITPPGQTAKP